MALRLRRGTDAERQLITPVEGELIYTTDTKLLYVGDGSTAGGSLVTGAGGGSSTLDALTDTNLTGSADGEVLTFVAGTNKWTPVSIAELFNEQQNYKINIVGDDSTIIIDTDTNNITGNTIIANNIISNLEGSVTGDLTGDLTGSIFTDNSTLVIDGQSGYLTTDRITSTDNNLEIIGGGAGGNALQVRSTDDKSILRLSRTSDTDLTGQALEYGSILFERIDVNGAASRSLITGYNDGLFIYVADQNNDFLENNVLLINSDGNAGFGTFSPTAKLDVRGNAIISGFVQFGSLTYLQRDALASAAGMVIWNSSSLQFEGFNGTNWINLIDGAVSTAP